MKIKIKFHLSSKLTGIDKDELNMKLDREISSEECLNLLGKKYPVFGKNFTSSFGTTADAENGRIPLLIMINNKSSGLKETIKQGDVVDIFLIAAGG